MFSRAIRPAPSVMMDDPIGMLNLVEIRAAEIEAALRALAALPRDVSGDPFIQATTLQQLAVASSPARDTRADAALHARVTALAKWTATHDPQRQSNAAAVIEAAARCPLQDGPEGVGFEPAGFQELTLFIDEMPW